MRRVVPSLWRPHTEMPDCEKGEVVRLGLAPPPPRTPHLGHGIEERITHQPIKTSFECFWKNLVILLARLLSAEEI